MDARRRLEDLFSAHGAAVRAYPLRRLGPGASASADDVVSEVFAVAWRRIDVVPAGAELPWLLGCARRVVLHVHRRARRDAALVEQLESLRHRPGRAGDRRPGASRRIGFAG